MTAGKTILVFCPNWVGDTVMATPAFAHLRNFYHDARIVAVIRGPLKPIIEDGPWFDDYVSGQDKTLKGFINLTQRLRTLKPYLAVVMPNSQRAALLAKLSGTKIVAGYKRDGRSLLLTTGPKPLTANGKIIWEPMKIYYLKLCQSLGVPVDFNMKSCLYFREELAGRAQKLLAKYNVDATDKLVGLIPGASFGPSKRWDPVKFGQLATLLEQQFKCKIIMFGAPSEADILDAVMEHTQAKIINTRPDNVGLDMMKPLVKRCDVLITNDTGPRQYGVALGVPQVIVILGSTTLDLTTDLETTTVVRKDLPCAPCQQKICHLGHNRCMTEITPEMVLKAVKL